MVRQAIASNRIFFICNFFSFLIRSDGIRHDKIFIRNISEMKILSCLISFAMNFMRNYKCKEKAFVQINATSPTECRAYQKKIDQIRKIQ
ncbi:hypothetical protein A3860_03505 [Niastella vici]|uniref:Uncharacterized protein n=1 Tax=Niastella vici TaxID=1703345 RepID=A0A1V9GAD7_9BACT|nr:hypothetical protein A3860_03505 [Niastella vici]